MLSSPPSETSRWESMLTIASSRRPSSETVAGTCEWMLWIIARIFGCRTGFSRALGLIKILPGRDLLDRYGRDYLAVGVVGDVDLLRVLREDHATQGRYQLRALLAVRLDVAARGHHVPELTRPLRNPDGL